MREFQVGDKVRTTRVIPVTSYKVTQKHTNYLMPGTMATFMMCVRIEDGEPLFAIELEDGTIVTDVDEASIELIESD